MGIDYKPLKELVDIVIDYRGKTPLKLGGNWSESGYRALSALNVKTRGLVAEDKIRHVDENLYKKWMKEEVKRGDILITSEAPFGQVLQWNSDEKIVLSQRLFALRIKPEYCSSYIYQYMASNFFYGELQARATGSTVEGLRQPALMKCKIAIPSWESQCHIASILSAYDSLIENNKKRIKLLEQMAENLYKEWFVRFRFPGYENVEFEEGIPKWWLLERLDDFGITLETGSRPKGGIDASIENGVPSLGAEAINGLAEFDYSSLKLVPQDYYDSMKRGKNKGNHILVYKDGAYIGKVTIFRNGFPFETYSINEHVFFLNAKDVSYQNYLYFTLHQSAFFTLMQNLNRNAAQPGLSQQDMYRIKVLKPTKNVVSAFNSFVEPIFNEVFNLAKENRFLTHQRDLLLPKLMSGKLSI